jgi:hypothetical protein
MKFWFIFSLTLLIGATLYAQRSYSFVYNEWPDGCLTMHGQSHYDYSDRHRNDNTQVKNEIEFFNNWVRQNNATVTTDKAQLYLPSVGTRSAEIYTNIILVATSSGGSSVSSGNSSGSSSGYYPSTTSSYNPADSSYLQFGYNYAYKAPFGLTIGDIMFFERTLIYISFNFGLSSFDFGSNSLDEYMEPSEGIIEWIYGFAISVNNWLRIPIGIGGNHTNTAHSEQVISGSWYDSSKLPPSGYHYRYDRVSEWSHSFVIEAGLQPVIADRFYLSATYRLIGFSKSGFTIGAGIIF